LCKTVAQRIGSAAFFDQEILTSQESFFPQFMINFDIKKNFILVKKFKIFILLCQKFLIIFLLK